MNAKFDEELRRSYIDEGLVRARTHGGKTRYPSILYSMLVSDWMEHEAFCPRCGAKTLEEKPVLRDWDDFTNYVCQGCGRDFYVISSYLNLRGVARSSCYRAIVERIEAHTAPDIICLRYDRDAFEVTDLFVLPGSCLRKEYLMLGTFTKEPEEGHDIWCDIAVGRMLHELGDVAVVDILGGKEQRGPSEVMRVLMEADRQFGKTD